MSDIKIPVEQLWYTWSDVGLSSIHAGFRVRAASPGLTEIYGPRAQSMDRYMRYVLPPDTNRATITPETAPIGLAFIRTDWSNEYILVHKNYSGKDGVGRPGNFFVHVLALGENSSSFSAEDAIWLWNAEIWRTDDQGQDRRSNELTTIPITALDSNPRFRPDFAQVRHALPFLIEAYLTRKGKAPLYIAAPANQTHMIAYLIAGLLNCLPSQFLTGVTFSTYEPDITKATTEIVGTSWIATPGKDDASQVLPPLWSREKLAINCATGEHSELQSHPQATYNPRAAHFAAYATECLINKNMSQLYTLCALAEKSHALTIDLFLQLYNDDIANAENIHEAEIEKYLNNLDLCLDRLSSQIFRKKVIDRALGNRKWAEEQLIPILARLCTQAEREYAAAFATGRTPNTYAAFATEQEQTSSASPQGLQKKNKQNNASGQTKKAQLTLADALALLAKRAIPEIVDAMKQGWRARGTAAVQTGEDSIEELKREQIILLFYLMNNCLLPQDPNKIWLQLFDGILKTPTATDYLKAHWSIRFLLFQVWNKALPVNADYDNAVHPLMIVPWNRLGKFLKISLAEPHKQWIVFAVEKLIADTSLTPQATQELEQSYAQEVNELLEHLIIKEENIITASSFLTRILEKGYRVNQALNALIERLLTSLLANNSNIHFWLAAKELIATLTRTKYRGTPSYQSMVEMVLGNLLSTDPGAGNELFEILIAYGYPGKKALIDILLITSKGRANLGTLITRVCRTPEELNTFFLKDGAQYLSTPEHVQAMVSLYEKLLQYFPQSGKLERLFTLLDTALDEKTILHLLSITTLEGKEYVKILEQCGKDYLGASHHAPRLASKVVDWFTQLVKAGYAPGNSLLFKLFTPKAEYQYLEQVLTAAHLSADERREFFRTYGSVTEYIPFFRQSAMARSLFAGLALEASTNAGNISGEQLSTEKMDLLFAWLDPSTVPARYDEVESILHNAALKSKEQSRFLERYGAAYLSLYPQLLPLLEYIGTYMADFTTASLEKAEAKRFFTTLTQYYQHLRLDENTQKRIQFWHVIDSYCTLPTTQPEALRNLAIALYSLGLPNNARFTEKLAGAFVTCINTSNELNAVIGCMRETKVKTSELQFVYTIAEQGAARYQQQQSINVLLPYLVFALTRDEQETSKHFIQVFLDIIFCRFDTLNIKIWRRLNEWLLQQKLPHEAMERWNFYLRKLDLLNRLNTLESTETDALTAKKASLSWQKYIPRIGSKGAQTKQAEQGDNNVEPGSLQKHNPSVPVRQQQQPDMNAKQFRIMPHKQEKPLHLGTSSTADTLAEQQRQSSPGGTQFRLEEDREDWQQRH